MEKILSIIEFINSRHDKWGKYHRISHRGMIFRFWWRPQILYFRKYWSATRHDGEGHGWFICYCLGWLGFDFGTWDLGRD